MAFKLVNGTGNKSVSAQQDADLFSGIIGHGTVVLPVGERCRAEIMSSNTVRVHNGEIVSQGRRFNQAYGDTVDYTLDNGSQGAVRYDIIGIKFSRDSQGDETCETFVRKDIGESGTVIEDDIREGATTSCISLYRVKLNGLNIESTTPLFQVINPIAELVKQTILECYPIGRIIMSEDARNPSEYLGGTWVAWGKGRVPVGVDASQEEFNTVEKTGGEKDIDLSHQHVESIGVDGNSFFTDYGGGSTSSNGSDVFQRKGLVWAKATQITDRIRLSLTSKAIEERQSVLQPYITCYMWKRIA